LGQTAALYCRVSTADQTCARQERDLRAFANKAGYKIVGVWKETASGAKDDRPERKEVLALAQARKIDVILVTELTRWGRSMLDLFHTGVRSRFGHLCTLSRRKRSVPDWRSGLNPPLATVYWGSLKERDLYVR